MGGLIQGRSLNGIFFSFVKFGELKTAHGGLLRGMCYMHISGGFASQKDVMIKRAVPHLYAYGHLPNLPIWD